MSDKAEISLTGALSGGKLGLTNPETGEVVVINLSSSEVSDIENIFPEVHD